jgi:hypothetical protein
MPLLTEQEQHNEWQGAHINRDISLESSSETQEWMPGRRKVAVKVVDVLDNDTIAIVKVTI